MKRILSFVLAAMLMFSLFLNIIPAAHADDIALVNVIVYDEDGQEIWSGTAPEGSSVVAWLDANVSAHIAKTGFTADKWYSKDSGTKFDASATFNGWTNVMVKYQAEVVEEPVEVPVRIFDEDGEEIWGGIAHKGDLVVSWLDTNATKFVTKAGYTVDKWYSKDSGEKFDDTTVFNGWTNVVVKYQRTVVEAPSTEMYVDVILNEKTSNFTADDYQHCILENGKVKQSDIDIISVKIKNKGIVGWTYDLNGAKVQADSLSKFDFSSLTSPINIYPVFEKAPENTTVNKFPYKAYLHIFADNKVDEPAKTIDITSGIALDGKVTLSEVKSVVKSYYTAKTSDGIGYDGLYMATDNWVGKFVKDEKVDTLDIKEDLNNGYVHINVMITNAKLSGSSTSNGNKINVIPKTGDNTPILAVAIIGLAAAVGLVVVVLNHRKMNKSKTIAQTKAESAKKH